MNPSAPGDEPLAACLARAAAGQATAFEAFYDATVGPARALARRMLDAADVPDVLADAYFDAWRQAARYDPTRGSAVAWLLTMVRSRALDHLRWQRRQTVVPAGDALPDLASTEPDPSEQLWQQQAGSRLHAALAGLSVAERWVLGLAYFRDLSHAAIAQATGLPLGSVKSLIGRAQSKLRRQLAS